LRSGGISRRAQASGGALTRSSTPYFRNTHIRTCVHIYVYAYTSMCTYTYFDTYIMYLHVNVMYRYMYIYTCNVQVHMSPTYWVLSSVETCRNFSERAIQWRRSVSVFHTHMCMRTHIRICVHIYVHAYILDIPMYMYTYTCTHIHIDISNTCIWLDIKFQG